MKHYSGNYFCTESNWDNDFYDARNLVSISAFPDEYGNKDFLALVDETDEEETMGDLKWLVKRYYLKKRVIDWLTDNVPLVTDRLSYNPSNNMAWCCGTKKYNSDDNSVNIWFYRRKDALAFIREFSVYGKPTEYYNQNSYIHKKLNLQTNTLQLQKP